MSTNKTPADENRSPVDQYFAEESKGFIEDLRTEIPENVRLHAQVILYTGPICIQDALIGEAFKGQVQAMKENLKEWVETIREGFPQLTDEKVEWENKIHPDHNPRGFIGRWKYSARLYSIVSFRQVESLEAVS